MRTFTPLYLLIIAAVTLSTGCANQRLANYEQLDSISTEAAEEFSGDSERALASAESRYEAAVASDMDFYAPLHMEQATETLYQARGFEIKGLQDESLAASSKVITVLRLAEKNKTNVESMLQPLLKQKQVLEELNSPRVLPEEFKEQLEEIKDLIKDIESKEKVITNDIMQPILDDLKELELDTLLTIHWQPAQKTLDKAKDEDADKNAPQSFTKAEEIVEESETKIRNNYSDREFVARQGLKALRTAQHALYLARDAELLVKMDKKRAENAALAMENLLNKIAVALKMGDVRHMALADQVNAIAQAAETQGSRLIAPLQARINMLENQLESATTNVNETNVTEPEPTVGEEIPPKGTAQPEKVLEEKAEEVSKPEIESLETSDSPEASPVAAETGNVSEETVPEETTEAAEL
jgi:hypothetical protein